MHKGELTITGHDHIELELDRRPEHITVHFKEEKHHHVPCNPGHHDELDYLLHEREECSNFSIRKHHQYILEIKWRVHGSRIIEWRVHY